MTTTMNANNTLTITEDLAFAGKNITTGEIYRRNISDALALIDVTINLPVLTGSEKQIAWAEDIRQNKITHVLLSIRDKIVRVGAEATIAVCQTQNANIKTISEAFELIVMHDPRIRMICAETSASEIINSR